MYKYNMVVLLSSGKINNRLLCELATHPNFLRLMVDMEILIDRIADMRVNQMNLILEATRQTILKEHAPGENNLYMRTLELGQVQENDFYSHILHDDLDSIVQDIREAHLKDKTTADPQPDYSGPLAHPGRSLAQLDRASAHSTRSAVQPMLAADQHTC